MAEGGEGTQSFGSRLVIFPAAASLSCWNFLWQPLGHSLLIAGPGSLLTVNLHIVYLTAWGPWWVGKTALKKKNLLAVLYDIWDISSCGSVSKESACNAGDLSSIPGLGRAPGGGHGNPLQYSCLENPRDRGAWRAAVCGVAKSQTRLSDQPQQSLIKAVPWPRIEPVTAALATWSPNHWTAREIPRLYF